MTTPSADELTAASHPTGVVRFQVLGTFSLLAAITYLDRVCMAQAAGSIRKELDLDAGQMSLVFSAFTLGYTLFEVPTGRLGDAIGPRRVLGTKLGDARALTIAELTAAHEAWFPSFMAGDLAPEN